MFHSRYAEFQWQVPLFSTNHCLSSARPNEVNMLSGMVRSSRKVRLLVHSSGFGVGKAVGEGAASTTITVGVGWIMKVGSMRGASMVGGRNGVGVETAEHAEPKRETRIKIGVANGRVNARPYRNRYRRFFIKKGRPSGSPGQGTIYASSSRAVTPPPSVSTPMSSGRAISPLRAFWRMTVSISAIKSGF